MATTCRSMKRAHVPCGSVPRRGIPLLWSRVPPLPSTRFAGVRRRPCRSGSPGRAFALPFESFRMTLSTYPVPVVLLAPAPPGKASKAPDEKPRWAEAAGGQSSPPPQGIAADAVSGWVWICSACTSQLSASKFAVQQNRETLGRAQSDWRGDWSIIMSIRTLRYWTQGIVSDWPRVRRHIA